MREVVCIQRASSSFIFLHFKLCIFEGNTFCACETHVYLFLQLPEFKVKEFEIFDCLIAE